MLGTLFRASQFLSEELPIRLAHRVQELGDLPDGLNEMESIKRVQDWYAQSFEVRISLLGRIHMGNCLTSTGNYNPTETQPQHRSPRASVEADQKQQQDLAHPQRNHPESEHKTWTIQIRRQGIKIRRG